jgi:hypothetical protein
MNMIFFFVIFDHLYTHSMGVPRTPAMFRGSLGKTEVFDARLQLISTPDLMYTCTSIYPSNGVYGGFSKLKYE